MQLIPEDFFLSIGSVKHLFRLTVKNNFILTLIQNLA